MLTVVLALFQVMGLASSVHAILNVRTSQGAIAWVVSLNTMPILTVPAYWVLGRSKFAGYVNTLKHMSRLMADDKRKAHGAFSHFMVAGPEEFPEYRAIRKLSLSPFLSGNRVKLLIDGKATFGSLEQGIHRASSYILFQFYILRADSSGTRFMEQLARKAGEGIQVHVLYDEIGSHDLPDEWLSRYRTLGVQIIPFNTTRGPGNRFQINFRNHRKIVVVDGQEAWLGGLNIGDEYLGKDRKLSPWRDTHLHVTGPAALVAQSLFWSDWYWADQNLLSHLQWQPKAAPGVQEGEGQKVLILGSGPADDLETASLFFTTVLNSAIRRIWIATPYFIPDEAIQVALRLALLRGVDVRIITPGINDNWFVHHAANVYLSELSVLGARIFIYDRGFMHQKVLLVDDDLSMIGTVNFDNRS
ncbi:MAG TPA: cardiolipin synthase, partial [Chromatiaceae bacterium]|nr:cardiolipin synthase [Chromatiaceae bacterium]